MTHALGLSQVSARAFLGHRRVRRQKLAGLWWSPERGEEAVRMERPNHLLSAVGFQNTEGTVERGNCAREGTSAICRAPPEVFCRILTSALCKEITWDECSKHPNGLKRSNPDLPTGSVKVPVPTIEWNLIFMGHQVESSKGLGSVRRQINSGLTTLLPTYI